MTIDRLTSTRCRQTGRLTLLLLLTAVLSACATSRGVAQRGGARSSVRQSTALAQTPPVRPTTTTVESAPREVRGQTPGTENNVVQAPVLPVTEARPEPPPQVVKTEPALPESDKAPALPGPPQPIVNTAVAEPPRPVRPASETVQEIAKAVPTVSELAQPLPQQPVQQGTGNLAQVREIIDGATAHCSRFPNYSCRVTRRERVGKKVGSEETMLMHFRLHPRSVYYKWLDEANTGRECIYVENMNNGKISMLGGRGDMFFTGKRMPLVDPDGILARSKSRYSIRESGLDNMVRRLERIVALQEKGDALHGVTTYQGTVQRKDVETPLHYILQKIPMGTDPAFPEGGTRHWYFEVASGRMTMMHADDPQGEFIEYYLFDRFMPNESLSDLDFNPDAVWSKTEGSGMFGKKKKSS